VAVAAKPHGVLQQPAAIRIKRDARIGKTLGQGNDGFHLFLAPQNPSLEFEVPEAIAPVRRFGQGNDGIGIHGRFVAQAQPVVARARFRAVGQVGFLAISNVEKIAQHGHRVALLSLAQERSHGYSQKLTQQIKQRTFHRCDGVNRHTQVKSLVATAPTVPFGKAPAKGIQNLVPLTD